jgi:hypothetical protein
MMVRTGWVAIVVAMSLATACGSSGDDDAEAPTTTPTADTAATTTSTAGNPADDPTALGEQFVNLIFGSIGKAPEALALAAPDTPASRYAAFFGAMAAVDSANGFEATTTSTVSSDGSIVKSCSDGTCVEFEDFQVTDGLITSFTHQGVAIDDRLGGAGAVVTAGSITAQVLRSYWSPFSDSLMLVLEITSADAVTIDWEPTYTAPDGTEQSALFGSALGPELAAGETQQQYVGVGGAELGGALTITVTDAAGAAVPLTLDVPAA